MRYFDIETIKQSIERLQNVSGNWLLPTFVFAANDVGVGELVDLSRRLGTDQFLDRYFNGELLGIPPFASGNNLLRPRLRGIHWDRGRFAGDYIVRQNTKMWGNLFSSRGYREMRLEGLIEGERAVVALTEAFQVRLEEEIPSTFRFEDFLVWLFAFRGLPEELGEWPALMNHLLQNELQLKQFKPPYRGRFKLATPPVTWPPLLTERPSNKQYLEQLAPKLANALANGQPSTDDDEIEEDSLPKLGADDPVLSNVRAAIQTRQSLAFLLAGPPGTGKTRYARQLALAMTNSQIEQTLFLQFHPAIGYDDFIEGFRPATSSTGSGVRYELAPRLFLDFSQRAAKDPDNTYVAVIDELNRGDVARIFGEVLTYIEPDYRGREFSLSFSGQRASLPPNLVLIATANPYDRSVTDLDDALLRRFWTIEFEPDIALLKSHLQSKSVDKNVINRTAHMFTLLNDAFPTGFGHTAFMHVRSVEDLAMVWSGRVRLALRRALIHDRPRYNSIVAEIEKLFASSEEGEGTLNEGKA